MIYCYCSFQLYILDDVDEPVSGAKKSSKELASVLRNLKKVEQALETVDAAFHGIWNESRVKIHVWKTMFEKNDL